MAGVETSISFSGCGFLGIYHIGVASCLRRYAPHLLSRKVAGASAGALSACVLLCGCELGQCTSFTLQLSAKARERGLGPFHPTFDIVEHLRHGLDLILPPNAHKICSGKMYISMTRFRDWKNVVISQYNSRDQLIQALICTSFIPLWSGITLPLYDGEAYLDGSLSDNIPVFPKGYTVTVAPFYGEFDICPRDSMTQTFQSIMLAGTSLQMSLFNLVKFSKILFPPAPEECARICQQGFSDALRFLRDNGYVEKHEQIIQVRACLQENKDDTVDCPDSTNTVTFGDIRAKRIASATNLAGVSTERRGSNDSRCSSDEFKRRYSVPASQKPKFHLDEPLDLFDNDPVESPTRSDSDEIIFRAYHQLGAPRQNPGNPVRKSASAQSLLPSQITSELNASIGRSRRFSHRVFQGPAYRLASVLCSPLYLPPELAFSYAFRIVYWLFDASFAFAERSIDRFARTITSIKETVIWLVFSLPIISHFLRFIHAAHIFVSTSHTAFHREPTTVSHSQPKYKWSFDFYEEASSFPGAIAPYVSQSTSGLKLTDDTSESMSAFGSSHDLGLMSEENSPTCQSPELQGPRLHTELAPDDPRLHDMLQRLYRDNEEARELIVASQEIDDDLHAPPAKELPTTLSTSTISSGNLHEEADPIRDHLDQVARDDALLAFSYVDPKTKTLKTWECLPAGTDSHIGSSSGSLSRSRKNSASYKSK